MNKQQFDEVKNYFYENAKWEIGFALDHKHKPACVGAYEKRLAKYLLLVADETFALLEKFIDGGGGGKRKN